MSQLQPDTEELIARASGGDDRARQQLLIRHHDRLIRMVAVRLDRRLAAQSTRPTSCRRRCSKPPEPFDYLRDRPLPFHAWLRQYVWQRLSKLHRHHLGTQRRSVTPGRGGGLEPARRVDRHPGRPSSGAGLQPESTGFARGAAPAGSGRAGEAGSARPRSPGIAAPGAALDGRGRRGAGDQLGGREEASPPGTRTPPRPLGSDDD